MPSPAADPLHAIRQLIAENHRGDALRAVDVFARNANADDLHRVADLLQSIGELDRAIDLYRRALLPGPRLPTLNNLGIALRKRGDARAALDAFQQAQTLGPVPPSMLNNIGNLRRQLGDIDEALLAFQAALRARPNDPDTLNNFAAALLDAGRISEAIAIYRKVSQISADHPAAGALLYALHVLPLSAAQLAAEHNAWGDRFAGLADIAPFVLDRHPNRRLRVGLISPNFETHPVGRFLLPLVEHIDRSAIEFICYSDVAREDAMTARFKSAAADWRTIVGLDDAAVTKQIRGDRIDILIDLSLHLEGSRLKVFARRAAPVQATYLAYNSTSGLAAMDYRLTDAYFDPENDPGGGANAFPEKPMRLAHSYWCYPAPPDAPPVGPLPVTASGRITFGCLNNFRKISAAAVATWCEVLMRMPASRMIVHAHRGAHRNAFRAAIAARGIDGGRVEFQAFENFNQYLASYRAIDLALDTFPYTGGTTSCDAMWMGVPVVTLAGATPIARGGVSVMSNVGLPELIAGDAKAYVEIAASLAGDIARLTALRSTLRDRMQASPLMQADLFCRDFEAACRAMWRTHCGA